MCIQYAKKKNAARSYPVAFFFIKIMLFITKIIIFQIKIPPNKLYNISCSTKILIKGTGYV